MMIRQYKFITRLNSIKDSYDTYIVDIAGVLYDGRKPFYSAITTINKLIKQDKKIIFLSNNPRPSTHLHKQLNMFGISENYHIVTSGDLLHHILATELKHKKIYHLGRNRQHALLEGTNIQLTSSLADADAIILSCFVEGNEDRALFDDDLKTILASEKPVYCPNPDQLALEGTILRYPSGYFAHKLRQKGGIVTYLGKPSNIIYNFITQKYPHISFDKPRTIMIGDTLETDICGAIDFGIDSLLLLSGVTGLFIKENPNVVRNSLYKPTYVMEKL